MQTTVALQWHHHQHLPPSSLIWQHLHSPYCCRCSGVLMFPMRRALCRAVQESQLSRGELEICPWDSQLGLEPPLKAWRQECMVHPHLFLWEEPGFQLQQAKISFFLSQAEHQITEFNEGTCGTCCGMWGNTKLYLYVSLKVHRRVITSNDSFY